MKRQWYQGDHYDVSLEKRQLALQYGAIEVSQKQLAAMNIRLKETGSCGTPEEALNWFKKRQQNRKND